MRMSYQSLRASDCPDLSDKQAKCISFHTRWEDLTVKNQAASSVCRYWLWMAPRLCVLGSGLQASLVTPRKWTTTKPVSVRRALGPAQCSESVKAVSQREGLQASPQGVSSAAFVGTVGIFPNKEELAHLKARVFFLSLFSKEIILM